MGVRIFARSQSVSHCIARAAFIPEEASNLQRDPEVCNKSTGAASASWRAVPTRKSRWEWLTLAQRQHLHAREARGAPALSSVVGQGLAQQKQRAAPGLISSVVFSWFAGLTCRIWQGNNHLCGTVFTWFVGLLCRVWLGRAWRNNNNALHQAGSPRWFSPGLQA